MVVRLDESWFRFGLPLGSALILAAILDTASNFFTTWLDLGAVFLIHINQAFKIDPITAIWIAIILVWNISNLGFLWVGTIFQGKAVFLLAWIVTTVICGVIALAVWLYSLSWIWQYPTAVLSEVYSMITYILTTGYLLNLAILVLKSLRAAEAVEPLGKGVMHIVKFYRDDPTLAAKFLLISEMVIIAEYVFARQVMQFGFERDMMGHEGDTSAAIIAEEYVIRCLRFFVSGAGLVLVLKGKLLELKWWGLVYLGLLLASIGIFLFVLVEWRAEHPFFTIGYAITFLISLIYRSTILYMCMKVIQPYIASSSFLTLQESA